MSSITDEVMTHMPGNSERQRAYCEEAQFFIKPIRDFLDGRQFRAELEISFGKRLVLFCSNNNKRLLRATGPRLA